MKRETLVPFRDSYDKFDKLKREEASAGRQYKGMIIRFGMAVRVQTKRPLFDTVVTKRVCGQLREFDVFLFTITKKK